jgi:hypothetical protein
MCSSYLTRTKVGTLVKAKEGVQRCGTCSTLVKASYCLVT